LLAVTGPILTLAGVDTKGVLAAVSAGWLVLGRVLLMRSEQRARARGVAVQELFDTRLFHLPWNEALAGRPPLPEDVACAHRKEPPAGADGTAPWLGSVDACTTASATSTLATGTPST
jgi:hypothetical protein